MSIPRNDQIPWIIMKFIFIDLFRKITKFSEGLASILGISTESNPMKYINSLEVGEL